MFELPDAKRVRREELYDSDPDHSSTEREHEVDAELRAKLNARLSSLLSLDLNSAIAPAAPEPPEEASPPNDEGADEEAEFEFRLFSTSTAAAPKVVMAPEEEDKPFTGPPITQRPASYYIRGELSSHERAQFESAAVTARDVLTWAGQRAWGLEVPWRVTKITVAVGGKQQAQQRRPTEGVTGLEEKKKKTRPGKKTRIVLRKRERARKEMEAAQEKTKMSKEEHLKEKKKRLNREKKLKRRQKEKEKKLAAKGGAAGEGEGDAGSGSEGSDGEE